MKQLEHAGSRVSQQSAAFLPGTVVTMMSKSFFEALESTMQFRTYQDKRFSP